MEQTFEQTITIVVPTINGSGGGTLASTGASVTLVTGLALLLVITAIATLVLHAFRTFTQLLHTYCRALALQN